MAQFTSLSVAVALLVGLSLADTPEENKTHLSQRIQEELSDLGQNDEAEDPDEKRENLKEKIVKMLLIQSWVRCFKPDDDLVKGFLDDVSEEDYEQHCIQFVEKKSKDVPEAVLDFLDKWQRDITYAENRIGEADLHIQQLQQENSQSNEELIEGDRNQKNEYLDKLQTALALHEMVRQSFVIDFHLQAETKPDQQEQTFQITSAAGEVHSFAYPPLNTLTQLS